MNDVRRHRRFSLERMVSLEAAALAGVGARTVEQVLESMMWRLYEARAVGMLFGRVGGKVAMANDAALAMLGYERADVAGGGLEWTALFGELEPGGRVAAELAERGACRPFDRELVGKDGRRVPALVALARLEDDALDRVAAVLVDLSDHRCAAAPPPAPLGELEELVSARDLILGVVGHDLRNPLCAIKIAAQHLKRQTQGQDLGRQVDRILSSTARMSRMVEQLLDFTRARGGGGLPMSPTSVDLRELCRQAIDEAKAGAAVPFELSCAGDPVGSWDRDRLAQLCANLIGNALQHGAPDRPVSVRIDGEQSGALFLGVHNEGSIAPELLPRLFEPFASGRARRAPTGLGLGLFIAQEVALAHGGRIDVASDPIHGTTFTVRLPRAARRP